MADFQIRPLTEADRSWMARFLIEHWASTRVVSRGRVHQADCLPGFVAESNGQIVGLVTYCIEGEACEVVSLDSLREGVGIGSALLDAVRVEGRKAGCRRTWLITTNDNLRAIGFYLKRGWQLISVHRNALDESRRLKPEIPLVGMDGIPLRDEIEFEINP